MPALHAVKFEPSAPSVDFPLDAVLRKLAPNLARAASETASAFFNAPVSLAPAWEAPRAAEGGRIHCSQKNLGEKYEMVCNLTVDKAGWDRLFPPDLDERMRMDAYCELANCICGALLADPGFADWFGYLIPCVPCTGPGCPGEGAQAARGALRLNGAWILFSFAVREIEALEARPGLAAA
jgi:hypothetical protein